MCEAGLALCLEFRQLLLLHPALLLDALADSGLVLDRALFEQPEVLDHCLETLTLLAEHLCEQGAGKVEAMLECLHPCS